MITVQDKLSYFKIKVDEVKKSANPSSNAIKNFDIVEKFGYPIGNGIVLCMMENILPIDENNYFIPIEYI